MIGIHNEKYLLSVGLVARCKIALIYYFFKFLLIDDPKLTHELDVKVDILGINRYVSIDNCARYQGVDLGWHIGFSTISILGRS